MVDFTIITLFFWFWASNSRRLLFGLSGWTKCSTWEHQSSTLMSIAIIYIYYTRWLSSSKCKQSLKYSQVIWQLFFKYIAHVVLTSILPLNVSVSFYTFIEPFYTSWERRNGSVKVEERPLESGSALGFFPQGSRCRTSLPLKVPACFPPEKRIKTPFVVTEQIKLMILLKLF